MMFAACQGQGETCRVLLAAGTGLEERSGGMGAAELAEKNGHNALSIWLREAEMAKKENEEIGESCKGHTGKAKRRI